MLFRSSSQCKTYQRISDGQLRNSDIGWSNWGFSLSAVDADAVFAVVFSADGGGGWSCDTPATWLQRREIRTQSPCRQTAFSRSSFLAPRPLTAPHPFLPTDRSNAGRLFSPAAGAHHLKAAFFRRKRTLHPDPQI